jgi:hypothetical protein
MAKANKHEPLSVTQQSDIFDVQALHGELNRIKARITELEQERDSLQEEADQITQALGVIRRHSEKLLFRKLDDDERQWNDLANLGIQEACYRVLLEASEPLDATEIRQRLSSHGVKKMGNGPEAYANQLAVIHTSLKRIPDRIKSTKRKVKVLDDQRGWVRYYEAIRPGAEKPPSK